MAPSRPSTASMSTSEPAFICTVCWQAEYLPARPKILGTSSRIVCDACWTAVLDLSICWVCGECIVRGDHVVSLGWCFWHQACFGCLICGTQICLSVVEENAKGMGKRSMGVELDEIPLCHMCGKEMQIEMEGQVRRRNIVAMSSFDGGMSPDRLDMMNIVEDEDERRVERSRWRTGRGYKGSSGLERDLTKFINGSSRDSNFIDPYQEHTKGKEAEKQNDDDIPSRKKEENEESDGVYFSITDPMGNHVAVAPRKNKSSPRWMSFLPQSNHARNIQLSPNNFQESGSFSPNPSVFSPTESETGFSAFPAFDNANLQSVPPSPNPETVPIGIPGKRPRRRTSVSFDTIPSREYSILRNSRKKGRSRSRTLASHDSAQRIATDTPPRRRTPYPGNELEPSRRTQGSLESTSCPTSMRLGVSDAVAETSYGLGIPSISPSPEIRGIVATPSLHTLGFGKGLNDAVQSSEYLDKYCPKGCEERHEKYVPRTIEPIMEKIKRQRIEDARDRKSVKGREKISGGDEAVEDRRVSLVGESRSLFNEE